jgi:predicted anti-sigma-YlaC factor YlaD
MSDCDTIRALLDEYLDGTLVADDQTRVSAHLGACASCRREEEATRAVLARARTLPRSVLPSRELWSGIAEQIGGSTARQHDGATKWRVPAVALQAAAAIGLTLLGASLATTWQHRTVDSGFTAEQARYARASAALAERLAGEPDNLAPATRAVVERNLAIVDAAIREAEAALLRDPGSPALEQMLVARYEQRLALLRHAIENERTES